VVQARDVDGGIHFHQGGPSDEELARMTPRQLPPGIRGFVNRVAEFGHLNAVLSVDDGASFAASTLVITGTAGVGKTSLAVRWAHEIADRFPDGQLYVNLRGYDSGTSLEPGEVLHRFLTALGVPAASIPPDPEAAAAHYRSRLAHQRVLVVLDNAATVAQVRPLLSAGSGCLTIVTSRNRLAGLAIRDGAQSVVLDTLSEGEAVALLRSVTKTYRAQEDPRKLAELAHLCARLPLALRIAAERAVSHPHLRLDDLIAELRDESFLWHALSTGEDEDAEAVRTVFAWSYRALPEASARLFRLLGLHPGADFGLHAAAALAGTTVSRTRQMLDTLVGAHLLLQTAPDRFEFHDLLRLYATDQARGDEPPAEREAALRRVLSWYLCSADAARAWLKPDASDVPRTAVDEAVTASSFTEYDQAVDWCEREFANIQAAAQAAADARLDAMAWQLPMAQWLNWTHSAPLSGWIDLARNGLAAARRLGDRPAQAWLLECLGEAHSSSHQFTDSEHCFRRALAIRHELGNRLGEATVLNALGLLFLRRRKLADAADQFRQAGDIFQETGDAYWLAYARINLAEIHVEQGHLAEADTSIAQALEIIPTLGNQKAEGSALRVLSRVRCEQGALSEALETAQRTVNIAVRMRLHLSEAFRLLTLGDAQRANGMFGEALASYQRTALVFRRAGDPFRQALAWHGAGLTYHQLGRDDEAAAFHRQAAAVFHDLADGWNEALALDGLALATAPVDADAARRHGNDALALLAGYEDDRAVALREGIRSRNSPDG
jgi:tetratricopeptide (TPR) repeat protein